MIKSMTGFGSANGSSGKLEITVEVKSVNNRHLDCSVKIPRMYASLEATVKSTVAGCISRGKVDISVFIDSTGADDIEVKVNHTLATSYINALHEIAEENSLEGTVSIADLTKFPDVLQVSKREVDTELLGRDINDILRRALDGFEQMRCREGEKLRLDILARLDEIERLTVLAEEISPQTVADYREKLEQRMKDVLQSSGIDEARILTEAAIFADRVAINEETVRLRSHIAQLRELMGQGEAGEGGSGAETDSSAVGRKIDFLLQEFNREANTIGSKGNDACISKVVVDLKSEIEKIREQAQNVE